MINFEEELKKFHPSLELQDAEEILQSRDMTDMTDIFFEFFKETEVEQE
ncbi:MAG: hypothetical protein J6K26_09900 [Lachnospiraceae bacterium]|nr:hypothetical protein [Lachnospiraceae bacterium]